MPVPRFLLQRHPGGTANAVYGEATHSQVPRDGRRPSVHDLPCEAVERKLEFIVEGIFRKGLYP